MDILTLLEERTPSKGLAISVVILGVLSTLFSISASLSLRYAIMHFPHVMSFYTPFGLIGISIILSLIAGLLQLLLLFSWNRAIKNNIENTKLLFQFIQGKISESKRESIILFLHKISQLEIATWAFWIYALFYTVALISGIGLKVLLNILAFIFLAIYLQSLFSVSFELSRLKSTAYSYFLGKPALITEIKGRNVIIVAILSIITFTIYWLYLLIKITYEISSFIEEDQRVRQGVLEAIKGP